MTPEIELTGQACGAIVRNVDLTKPLDEAVVSNIRAAWLEHHVLVFPEQAMSDDDLERFTQYFGSFGHDPFIAPVEGRENIIAVKRSANETTPIFAEAWHSDWSFQATPPSGTCLFGITIPPKGGDTLFADQHKALEAMPEWMRKRYEGLVAVHSARNAYGPKGYLGDDDKAAGRSMVISSSEDALETQAHPLVRAHPETGELGFFGCYGYIIGIEGMPIDEGAELLEELLDWQGREEFQYCHEWSENTLVMWDNRSVLHAASGGYQGFDRLLHRTTISASA